MDVLVHNIPSLDNLEISNIRDSYVPYRLDGKVALVTGSGRGIGAAIAVELGRLGANVVLNYANSAESAEKVVAEIKTLGSDAVTFKADVRQVPQTVKLMDNAVAHFGGLDIVVSNSGVVSFGHLGEVTEICLDQKSGNPMDCSTAYDPLTSPKKRIESGVIPKTLASANILYSIFWRTSAHGKRSQEEFDRVFSLNTRGQFFVAREAYRHLNESGRIILMSSNTAKDFSVPKYSLYSGSKGAIDSFVRVFAKDCGHKKITVNAVAPGGTVTDMFHDVSQHCIPNGEKYLAEERQQMAAHASQIIRNGFPIDITWAVCFLASKEAEWVNGKTITLDGGAA